MIRSLWICLALIALMTGSAIGQELKIGVVASELIVQSYPRFQQAEKQLAQEVQGWESERKTWEADMERLQKEIIDRERRLETGKNMLSEKKKEELQTDIDSLRMDFNERLNRQSTLEQERFNKRRAELLSEVFEIVNGEIEEMGDQEGYDLIIDASNGTVVYARDPDDLNDQLLRRLQDK